MAIQSVPSVSAWADYGPGALVRSVVPSARREEKGAGPQSPESAHQQSRQLTPEEQGQVRALQSADRRVRAHEQAHVATGGDLVRGVATFSYVTGPDDKRYAVAGEVSIDASPGRTPEETIPKAQHIRDTALAPADPSPQDRVVAARATQMQVNARRELAVLRQSETEGVSARKSTAFYLGVAENDLRNPGSGVSVFA